MQPPSHNKHILQTRHLNLHSGFLGIAALLFAALSPAAAQWVTPPVVAPNVQYRTFESQEAGTTVSYHLYTPPQYADQPNRNFPVVYWLHAAGGGTLGIGLLSNWFNNAIANNTIPPTLVVFPNGMSFSMWSDAVNGDVPMESVIINDLLPEVDANFRTIASREGRIIEGFSMGGYGAGRFGFKYPELFAGVSMLGAASLQLNFLDAPPDSSIPPEVRLDIYEQVWNSDPDIFLQSSPWTIASENAQIIIESGTIVRLAVGQQDLVYPENLPFQSHLVQLGIPHTFFTPQAIDHNPIRLLTAIGPSNRTFYRSVFRPLCPCDTDHDGQQTIADYFTFLADFFTQLNGPGSADLNADGTVTVADFFEYLNCLPAIAASEPCP